MRGRRTERKERAWPGPAEFQVREGGEIIKEKRKNPVLREAFVSSSLAKASLEELTFSRHFTGRPVLDYRTVGI